jgi:hypothetical protein
VMFLNGDSLEGVLNAAGTKLQGRVTYRNAADGSKLEGTIDPYLGYIEGPASYTFFDPTIGKKGELSTIDVHVVNGEFRYRNKVQQDLLKRRRGLSKAWKQIFQDGNILTKMEAGVRLLVNSYIYPFNFIAAKYNVSESGFSWSSQEGFGIIFGSKSLGRINLTLGDMESLVVDLSSKSPERSGIRARFENSSLSSGESENFSFTVELRRTKQRSGQSGEADEKFRQGKLIPVVGKKGTYFRDLSNMTPLEANEYLLDVRLENGFVWAPEQKAAIATSLNNRMITEKEADGLSKQLRDELISNHLERWHGLGPMQSFFMTECISWTIDRAKNGLKPEYSIRLYALIALARLSFDKSVWGMLRDRNNVNSLSDRQKFIIYESMQALEEFDRLIQQGQVDRKLYQVPVVPGLY